MLKPAFFIIMLFLVLISSSCKKEETLHLDDAKLISILVDIHVAEAAMQNMTKAVKDSLGSLYYQQIYEIHGIKESHFLEDFQKMRTNPMHTEKIYEKVLEELSKLETNAKKENDSKSKIKKDSTNHKR